MYFGLILKVYLCKGNVLCECLSIKKRGTYLQQCFWLFTELLYNLTADVEKRQRSQPSRAYFTQNGSQISQVSQQLRLDINRKECRRYTAYVKVKWDALVGRPCLLFFPPSSTHPPHDLDRSATVMLTLAHMLLFFLIYLCSFQLEQQRLSTLRQMFRQMSRKKTIEITFRLLALVSSPTTVRRGFCRESLLTLLLSKGTSQATMVPCWSNVWLQKLIETGNTVSFVT